VETLTRDEAARRAGMPRGYLDRMIELGLVEADADDRVTIGAVRRLMLLQALEATGVSTDAMVTLTQVQNLTLDFVDSSGYEIYAPLSDRTFGEVVTEQGVPMELLIAIREVMGGPRPAPGDRLRADELRIVPWAEMLLGIGVPAKSVDRMLRVYGDTSRRAAEAEASWWQTEIEDRFLAEGRSWAEIADNSRNLAEPVSEVSDAAMQAIHNAQRRQAWGANIIASITAALVRAGLHDRERRPPAMCFLDLTGYTRLTQERGDAAAAELAGRLRRVVDRSAAQHGGRTVKWLGDGVMFHFPDPGQAVLAALAMLEGVQQAGLPPAHVGLDAGPVIFQEGDYFGQTVNLASRIGEYARPGEALVSQAVVDAAGRPEGVRFIEIGAVELKGVAGGVTLHQVHAT
jgi:adenylate cyclase